MNSDELKSKIANILIHEDAIGENLAIALCTYFEDDTERPLDDPMNERGWSEWIEARCEEVLDKIVDASLPAWIPVSERLPKANAGRWSDNVLTWNGESACVDCYFHPSDGTGFWLKRQNGKAPTHWMPLPDAP